MRMILWFLSAPSACVSVVSRRPLKQVCTTAILELCGLSILYANFSLGSVLPLQNLKSEISYVWSGSVVALDDILVRKTVWGLRGNAEIPRGCFAVWWSTLTL